MVYITEFNVHSTHCLWVISGTIFPVNHLAGAKTKVTTHTCLYVSKKVPTVKLSVTLSNVNPFSNFLHCWKAHEACYKTYMTLYHFTLGMLLQYLGKFFLICRYSADMEKCKQLHFYRL